MPRHDVELYRYKRALLIRVAWFSNAAIYEVFQKSSPPPKKKTFRNIFISVKSFCVKFCKFVGSIHIHMYLPIFVDLKKIDKIQDDHLCFDNNRQSFLAADQSLGSVCPGFAEPKGRSKLASADQCLKF